MHTEHEAPVQHKAQISMRWTPHPVIVTIRDISHSASIGVLLYSYYTTTTGLGVLLTNPKL